MNGKSVWVKECEICDEIDMLKAEVKKAGRKFEYATPTNMRRGRNLNPEDLQRA